ncbi:hypothetical protein [Parasitella parasitica]|uniref:BHLH domain-containing protein n=1 Tax=Parasitella parasitica TaxID=35722 RepID=A0A0B7NR06_9FUNG|nr:hypothetical protein [Parasitella parasitica]
MSVERNNNKKKSTYSTAAKTSPTLDDSSRQLNMPATTSTLVSSSSNYPLGISFSSNIAHMNESDDIAHIEKRTAHNALERQRREGLNTKFQELAHVLPALQKIRRPSKSMIVAKSLEFVSSASKRESDYQGQIHALRKENEQLMRQASLSRRRMKKRLEQDAADHRKSPSVMINLSSKKRPSKLKAQSRQSTSEHIKTSKKRNRSEDVVAPKSSTSASIRKTQSPSPPSSIASEIQQLPSSPPKIANNKRRKRNATVETYQQQHQQKHQQQQQQYQQLIHSPAYHQQTVDRNAAALADHQTIPIYQPQQQRIISFQRPRFNSHQPSTANMQHQQHVSHVVSRHNSLTLNDQITSFDLNNTAAAAMPTITTTTAAAVTSSTPDQFNMIHSPFGNEQIFFNTFDNFDNIVSTIPALTTPSIGNTNNAHLNTPTSSSSASSANSTTNYENHLDIIQSIMQSQDPTTDSK